MHIKKHLSFTELREILSKRLLEMQDVRDENRVRYRIHDFFMTGFAMMYFQDPSLLAFQRRLQTGCHLNNLRTMFNIESIPKDTQLHDVLDQSPSEDLEIIFLIFSINCNEVKNLNHINFLMDFIWSPWMDQSIFHLKISAAQGAFKKKSPKEISAIITKFFRL